MKTINAINRLLLLLLVLSFASSCMTRLKVEVSVADRDEVKLQAEKNIKISLPRLFNRFQYQIDNADNLNNDYIDFLKATSVRSLIGENPIDNEIKLANESIKEISRDLDIARKLYEEEEYFSSFEELVGAENALLNFYDGRIFFFKTNAKLINDLTPDLSLKFNQGLYKVFKERKERVSKVSLDTERLRFNLLGDPLTFYVTKKRNKRDDFWKGLYNETKVSTFMGNADVAIILRKNPDSTAQTRSGDYNNNFTIKGVRLDAEDVVQASFRTLSQSINLFAAIQAPGANLNSNNSSSAFPILDTEMNTTLNNLELEKATLETKKMYLDERYFIS